MPAKKVSKKHSVVPNGASEFDASESEDEMEKVKNTLQSQLVLGRDSSSSEESDVEETNQRARDSKTKKKKKIHWTKKPFVPPVASFTGSFPPPPTDTEPEPIDYFYSMFGQQSIKLLTDQSNLYSVQQNPNKPISISEGEMRKFIGTLIMTGIYSFPAQRFFLDQCHSRGLYRISYQPRSIHADQKESSRSR